MEFEWKDFDSLAPDDLVVTGYILQRADSIQPGDVVRSETQSWMRVWSKPKGASDGKHTG